MERMRQVSKVRVVAIVAAAHNIFLSGRTVVGGSQPLIEVAYSGMVFQEYDDVDNTIRVSQMGMFWMYIWMLIMLLFMGSMM